MIVSEHVDRAAYIVAANLAHAAGEDGNSVAARHHGDGGAATILDSS